jgi:hypothetical protein
VLDEYLNDCIAPWIERQGKTGIYSNAYTKLFDHLVESGGYRGLFTGIAELYPNDRDVAHTLGDEAVPLRERVATAVTMLQLERNDAPGRKQIANAYLAYYFGQVAGAECPVPDEARAIVERERA